MADDVGGDHVREPGSRVRPLGAPVLDRGVDLVVGHRSDEQLALREQPARTPGTPRSGRGSRRGTPPRSSPGPSIAALSCAGRRGRAPHVVELGGGQPSSWSTMRVTRCLAPPADRGDDLLELSRIARPSVHLLPRRLPGSPPLQRGHGPARRRRFAAPGRSDHCDERATASAGDQLVDQPITTKKNGLFLHLGGGEALVGHAPFQGSSRARCLGASDAPRCARSPTLVAISRASVRGSRCAISARRSHRDPPVELGLREPHGHLVHATRVPQPSPRPRRRQLRPGALPSRNSRSPATSSSLNGEGPRPPRWSALPRTRSSRPGRGGGRRRQRQSRRSGFGRTTGWRWAVEVVDGRRRLAGRWRLARRSEFVQPHHEALDRRGSWKDRMRTSTPPSGTVTTSSSSSSGKNKQRGRPHASSTTRTLFDTTPFRSW